MSPSGTGVEKRAVVGLGDPERQHVWVRLCTVPPGTQLPALFPGRLSVAFASSRHSSRTLSSLLPEHFSLSPCASGSLSWALLSKDNRTLRASYSQILGILGA
jgi:hypothetical protein